MNKITAYDIVDLFKKRMNTNMTLGVTEFCPYGEGRRIDMFYLNRWNRECRGYEIKISRGDFLQDKKWENYLKYCTFFYFVAPKGIIKPSELPPNIGLIEITAEDMAVKRENEYEDDTETNYYLDYEITKRAKRLPPISNENYTQLLEGLLLKLIYNKNIQHAGL